MKQKKSKGKLILKILLVFIGIGLVGLFLLTLKIKNIYVLNNKILTDQDIIELAGISSYPEIFRTTSSSIIRKIKTSPFVEDVKVSKNLFGKITIDVKEYKVLFKSEINNTLYLSNGKYINYDLNIIGIPTLINDIDENILKSFIKKLVNVDDSILCKISEIEYTPNEYEEDLFLFYMNDGNCVYITTTRLLNINKYSEVLPKLEGQKGTLYLDSGNHFEPFEE